MAATRSLGVILTLVDETLAIADLTTLGEFGVESEEIDVTTLDSSSGYREYIAGSKDAGEVAIAGFTKSEANIETLNSYADAQTIASWTVEFPDGSEWAFDGFVKMFKEGESAVDSVRNFSGSIRITGEPVYTAYVSA